jgi:predicted ester cyclase
MSHYTATLGGNPPMPIAGHQGFAQAFYAGFPDIHHVIEQTIAAADAVVVRFVLHGTHTGSFFGIPPTGRAVTIAANVILHVQDGRVTKLLAVFDEAGLLRQMGVLPA